MINAIRQILTDADNKTHNVLRHGVAWGFLALVVLQAYALYKGQPFAPQDFGIALGAILGAGGVGIGLSSKAEPSPAAPADPQQQEAA